MFPSYSADTPFDAQMPPPRNTRSEQSTILVQTTTVCAVASWSRHKGEDVRGKASGLKWSVVTAVLVLLACVGPRALAQEPTEASVRAISAVQDALVWTGHYN